jgi:hypothetical protein
MRARAAATFVVAAAAVAWASELPLVALDCAPAAVEAIDDPLGRDGLGALRCPLPGGRGVLVLVSDENLSWPVLETESGRTSFEEALLSDVGLVGPGLPYVGYGDDRLLFTEDDPPRVLIEYATTDPSTGRRGARWLAIAVDERRIVGAADDLATAAALR